MSARRYIVMVWHQDDLTRVPEVSGCWQTFEAADAFAEAVMKRDEKLIAEPAPLYGKRVRPAGRDAHGDPARVALRRPDAETRDRTEETR